VESEQKCVLFQQLLDTQPSSGLAIRWLFLQKLSTLEKQQAIVHVQEETTLHYMQDATRYAASFWLT